MGGSTNWRSDDVTGYTVGLYTDLTHLGHIGRFAIRYVWHKVEAECKSTITLHNLSD
jgi:K+ transporter